MPGTTPRLGLTYEQGTDLVSSLPATDQANKTLLDNEMVIFLQGTAGARGVAGVQGRLYYETDTGLLKYDTGAAWVDVTKAAEPAFSTYKTLGLERANYIAPGASLAAGTIPLHLDPDGPFDFVTALAAFYFDPADYAAGARTTKLRLNAQVYTGSTAPGATLTFGLYPVTAVTATAPLATLGSVVAGSTVAFVTPAASSRNQAVSADFTAPAAGHYALAVATSATINSPAKVVLRCDVQMRQV